MKIREIMNAEVTTAGPESTIEEIARLMKQENIGTIPIVDSNDVLCGMITERDIVFHCVAEGHDASTVRAEDILSEEFECVAPDEEAEDVADRMREKHVQQLPAATRERLVGMISLDDIMQAEAGSQTPSETPWPRPEAEPRSAGVPQSGKRARLSARKASASERQPSKPKAVTKSAKRNTKIIPIRGNNHPGNKSKKVS